jgi:hypothetical protein
VAPVPRSGDYLGDGISTHLPTLTSTTNRSAGGEDAIDGDAIGDCR